MSRGSDVGHGEGLGRAELVEAGAPESLQGWAELLVARAREEGVALTGEGGLLTGLMRHVLQTGLEVEMAEHLGYGPRERSGWGSGNSRNGGYDKTRVDGDRGDRVAGAVGSGGDVRAGDGAEASAPA
jgi:Transposase, Mutator family